MANEAIGKKKKIAILGGGMASMAAAFELTATPELRDQYEVTIYQLGWRLGGKGASGRDRLRQDRNLEHGLHTWFGFYENAFHVMRKCYEELERDPNAPLATWEDAFKPDDWWVFREHYNGQWTDWSLQFPHRDGTPGDEILHFSFWSVVKEVIGLLKNKIVDYFRGDEISTKISEIPNNSYSSIIGEIFKILHEIEEWFKQIKDFIKGAKRDLEILAAKLLKDIKDKLWSLLGDFDLFNDHTVRRLFMCFDLTATIIFGIVEDNLIEKGFEGADDQEFSEWLESYGAKPVTINGPLVQAIYDLVFSYPVKDKKRNFAAGTALNTIIRLGFTYKRSIYWKMQAGMGDTVFTPFYEVLKRRCDSNGNRSVNFKFFHSVTKLGISDDDTSIGTIEVLPQVELTVEEYDPLILVQDLPCWPSTPRWDQLQNGEQLRQQGINFEYDSNPLGVKPMTLRKGVDFDEIILGISIAALPKICSEILRHEHKQKWQNMFDHVETVMTQAFQLWFNHDLKQLGWQHNSNAMSVTYIEPLSTLWNENQMIERENWPSHYQLQNIAYVCGILQDVEGESQKEATARAKNSALNFLKQDIKRLWPNATQKNSEELNWNLLIDPEERSGEARFDAQYWRANWQPTERYVLSVAGSTKYRLKTDESGYDNLYLAGDWIRTGFDAGCIEAATMGGRQASRAICGYPKKIVGEEKPWGYK